MTWVSANKVSADFSGQMTYLFGQISLETYLQRKIHKVLNFWIFKLGDPFKDSVKLVAYAL